MVPGSRVRRWGRHSGPRRVHAVDIGTGGRHAAPTRDRWNRRPGSNNNEDDPDRRHRRQMTADDPDVRVSTAITRPWRSDGGRVRPSTGASRAGGAATQAVGVDGLQESGAAFVKRPRMHRDAILQALEHFDPTQVSFPARSPCAQSRRGRSQGAPRAADPRGRCTTWRSTTCPSRPACARWRSRA